MNNITWNQGGDLTAYLQDLQKFPLLSVAREQDLARRWRDSRDEAALRELIGSHMRLVVKIARKNMGYGLPLEDLIAEGNVGLTEAAMRFDPDRGFRFSTYASSWILALIHGYVLRSSSLVKMGTTGAQKKLFFNLRRLKSQLDVLDNDELTPAAVEAIARELEVPEADVIQMDRRMKAIDVSLNAPKAAEGAAELQDFLPSEDADAESLVVEADELTKRRALLRQGMAQLTAREQHIITARKLSEEPVTLGELGEHYSISRERVRQIEAAAMKKLGKAMRAAALVDALPATAETRPLAEAA